MNIKSQFLLVLAAILTIGTTSCLGDLTKTALESDRSEISKAKKSLEYSAFIQQVEQGKVKKVGLSVDRTKALIKDPDGTPIVVNIPPKASQLIDILTKNSVEVYIIPN
jgi:ATP-dependent Zn protease